MPTPPEHPLEVSAEEVRTAMASADPPLLLDCRTDGERETASIEPSLHIPMDQLNARFEDLQRQIPDAGLIVYCHHGVRSLRVTNALRRAGIERSSSMAGGIEAWSLVIDPEVPRY